jgi:hypothetical protein
MQNWRRWRNADLLHIVEKAGGFRPSLYLSIEKPPFLARRRRWGHRQRRGQDGCHRGLIAGEADCNFRVITEVIGQEEHRVEAIN